MVTLTLLLSGCVSLHNIARQTGGRQSSQLLLESANKVKKGMAMTDVRRIIGKPAAITEKKRPDIFRHLVKNVSNNFEQPPSPTH